MPDGIQDRLLAVRQLMQLFRPERIAYLLAGVISLGGVFFFGFRIISDKPTVAAMVALAGSGGLISIGMGRLLTMWTQALRVITGEKLGD